MPYRSFGRFSADVDLAAGIATIAGKSWKGVYNFEELKRWEIFYKRMLNKRPDDAFYKQTLRAVSWAKDLLDDDE